MITKVHISSAKMVINKGDEQKNTLPEFNKNQIINAKVLKSLFPGRVQLLINGQKILADTSLPLTPGEQVQLKVLQETNAVVLKLIGPGRKLTGPQLLSKVSFLLKNTGMPDITGTKIPGVKELLFDMALKSDQPDIGFLPKLLEKSGMIWEKKVAQMVLGSSSPSEIESGLKSMLQNDMKANILKALMMSDFKKSDTLKAAASFVETTENFQILNHQSSESGRFLLPFPVFNEGTFRFGQLFIDTGDKNKNNDRDKGKIVRISFLLDMSRLGPLRADFSILKKEITGRFLLEDEKIRQYVASKIPGLVKGLADLDYHVSRVECEIAAKGEIQQNTFIETLVKDHDNSILNIVI